MSGLPAFRKRAKMHILPSPLLHPAVGRVCRGPSAAISPSSAKNFIQNKLHTTPFCGERAKGTSPAPAPVKNVVQNKLHTTPFYGERAKYLNILPPLLHPAVGRVCRGPSAAILTHPPPAKNLIQIDYTLLKKGEGNGLAITEFENCLQNCTRPSPLPAFTPIYPITDFSFSMPKVGFSP